MLWTGYAHPLSNFFCLDNINGEPCKTPGAGLQIPPRFVVGYAWHEANPCMALNVASLRESKNRCPVVQWHSQTVSLWRRHKYKVSRNDATL